MTFICLGSNFAMIDGGYNCHLYPCLYLSRTFHKSSGCKITAGYELQLPPWSQPEECPGMKTQIYMCTSLIVQMLHFN